MGSNSVIPELLVAEGSLSGHTTRELRKSLSVLRVRQRAPSQPPGVAPSPSVPLIELDLEIDGAPCGSWSISAAELQPQAGAEIRAASSGWRARAGALAESAIHAQPLRALRDVYPRALERVSDAVVGGLGVLDGRVGIVSEARKDRVRRLLPVMTLPSRVVRSIARALASAPAHDLLWLQIADASGELAALPWERLLRAATHAPIVRLSHHEVDTLRAERQLQVLVCCTSVTRQLEPSPRVLADMLRAIQSSRPVPPQVHLFADSAYHEPLRALLAENPAHIAIYPLPEPSPDKADIERERAWPDWVRAHLAGSAVDVLHLVAPCALRDGEPVVLCSLEPAWEPPRAETSVRMLRCVELAELASESGAATVVLSGFGSESARSATRGLCDRLSVTRPGAAAVLDFTQNESVARLYTLIDGSLEGVDGSAPSSLLYCHPDRFVSDGYEASPSSELDVKRPSSGPPLWVASTHRFMEQTLSSTLGASSGSQEADALRAGATEALRFIAGLLATVPEAAKARSA
jgi:hypothetical protein